MSVMHESVKDTVGDGGVPDLLVPLGDGDLRSHDGGAGLITLFTDFPEIAPLGFVKGGAKPGQCGGVKVGQ